MKEIFELREKKHEKEREHAIAAREYEEKKKEIEENIIEITKADEITIDIERECIQIRFRKVSGLGIKEIEQLRERLSMEKFDLSIEENISGDKMLTVRFW